MWAIGYVVLLVMVVAAMTTPYTGKQPLAFSRETWIASARFVDGTRFLMLDDLTSKHPLAGMTREEVLALLGPMQPENDTPFRNAYYFGPEHSPNSVDSAWLILTFKDDVVTAWRVGTD